MSLSIVKAKRKVSCLSCRVKKVRCDGGHPCIRCVNRNAPEQCTYSKPGQLGRPPKNAVVNKLVLNRTRTTSTQLYREFIFENVGYGIPLDSKFLNNDSSKNLYYFVDTFFSAGEAIMQLAVVRITKAIPYLPDIKMYDLLEHYVWSTVESLNVLVNRISALTLENFYMFDAIAAAVFQDLALKFFSDPGPELPVGNPLSTLAPQQAVQLIEAFFCISPHSLLLNKSLLLQGYWTDVVDPLLLCVVYGTTMYFSKLLDGRPVGLWEAVTRDTRNPFLDYAYALIQKSSSEVTLAKYQAVALLGLFESVFGHVKRGMANSGLAYKIGTDLGVSTGTYQVKSNKIQAELANVTFWSLFNSSIRGGVDLGHIPRFSRKQINLQLPPPTIEQSESYKFEESCGDARLFRGYYFLLESFYIQTVVCKYQSLILQQLPEVAFSMFRMRSSLRQEQVGHPKPHDLEPRLRSIIQEFHDFIQQEKGTWSKQQVYTVEMVWAIYDIHVDFLKTIGPFVAGSNYANSAYDFLQDTPITSGDTWTVNRVRQAIYKVYDMMDKTTAFLSDPLNYNEKPLLLPRGLMVSMLETCMQVLILKYDDDPEDNMAFCYLKKVEVLAHECIWVDWTGIQTVQNKLKTYFESNSNNSPLSVPNMGSSWDGDSELSTEDQLARAAFFDPCATWLTAPMTSLAMDLRLLDDLTGLSSTNNSRPIHTDAKHPINNLGPLETTGVIDDIPGVKVTNRQVLVTPQEDKTTTGDSLSQETSGGVFYIPSDPSVLLDDPTNFSIPSSTSPLIQEILFDETLFI
ncbi:hypothetical protein BC941DRAFT_372316 [Chlamydoabsidia padenii]|nr:hypothetical protein BC941DRAFT_372316 [Chlamydoabsidia padenii]